MRQQDLLFENCDDTRLKLLGRLGILPIGCLAVFVHGYHLGADDAAIYVPAIKKAANPALYPFGSEFFLPYARLSIFPRLVGGSVRLLHIPADAAIFLWHLASIFLLLGAVRLLMEACFAGESARWCGVALVAAVLTVPVAGTALVIMDPYVTSRSLSTPAALFAIASAVRGRTRSALGWIAATALIHPLMSVFPAALLGCLEIIRRSQRGDALPAFGAAIGLGLPFLFQLRPAGGAAQEALLSRTYLFVFQWAWYEWVGVFAPLALLAWASWASPRGVLLPFRLLTRALLPYGLLFTAAGAALGSSSRLESYAPLQPMRAFQLLYVVLFAFLGGLTGEYILQRQTWRWLILFGPLAAGMFLLQCDAYPASAHVEWPGWRDSGNAWTAAFYWIRDHTPSDAVFALDPDYMARPGEDDHGFRAIAERSVLADEMKDGGAVALFPRLANRWKKQVEAESGLDVFRRRDYRRLAAAYPVTWIVTASPGPSFATCPYRNKAVAVCRIGPGWITFLPGLPGAQTRLTR